MSASSVVNNEVRPTALSDECTSKVIQLAIKLYLKPNWSALLLSNIRVNPSFSLKVHITSLVFNNSMFLMEVKTYSPSFSLGDKPFINLFRSLSPSIIDTEVIFSLAKDNM